MSNVRNRRPDEGDVDMMKRAKCLNDAVATYREMRPDASPIAIGRLMGKLAGHFATDYSDAKGLKMLGLAGHETTNFVEITSESSNNGIEVECLIAVHLPSGVEVFDSREALAYDVFVKEARNRPAREKEIRERHMEEKHATNII